MAIRLNEEFRSTLDPHDDWEQNHGPDHRSSPFASWLASLFCWDGALPAFMLTFPYVLALAPLNANVRTYVVFWMTMTALVVRAVIVRRQLVERFPETRGVRFFFAGVALVTLGMVEGLNALLAQARQGGIPLVTIKLFVVGYLAYLTLMAMATISLPWQKQA